MNTRKLVETLVEETLDKNGAPILARAEAVCDYIESLDVSDDAKVRIFKSYKKALAPEIRKSRAKIELSGEVDEQTLQTLKNIAVRECQGRCSDPEVEINPALLGGIRIIAADTILEQSARVRLDSAKQ